MNKTIITALLIASISVLTACTPPDPLVQGSDPLYSVGGTVNAESSPEMRWARPPAVFVNDTYYQVFDARQLYVPELDDTWVYLGDIQDTVPGYESPTENFQANSDMTGAEIYHSYEGHIPVTTSTWGDPLEEEVTGDSIIVVFEGQRYLYISEDARAEAFTISDNVVRHSLMVDEVMYSLMATAGGDDFLPEDSYIFLGEVTSAVPLNEYPTENFQANRELVVGARVYRLPAGENNDLIVYQTASLRYYYKQLPETMTNP